MTLTPLQQANQDRATASAVTVARHERDVYRNLLIRYQAHIIALKGQDLTRNLGLSMDPTILTAMDVALLKDFAKEAAPIAEADVQRRAEARKARDAAK
jgi:hypothetical protein